jgi:hypothetical protein
MTDCCKLCKRSSDSITGEKFLEQLSDCQRFKENSASLDEVSHFVILIIFSSLF